MSRVNKTVDSAEIQSVVKNAAEAQLRCKLMKEPGRGRGETYRTPDGKVVSLRSSRDGDLLYQPVNGGTSFKTLDNVELVFLGTYDALENPTAIDIFCFDSKALREHFAEAYAYRRTKGVTPADNVGMGISLHKVKSNAPSSSHSGVIELGRRIASVPVEQIAASRSETEKRLLPSIGQQVETSGEKTNVEVDTIAAALADCRARIAKLAGLPLEAVALSLNITN